MADPKDGCVKPSKGPMMDEAVHSNGGTAVVVQKEAPKMLARVGKPETFNFLGFTHICSWNRRGKFYVLRQTMTKRMRAKLKTIQGELKQRMHHPIPEQGQWLRMVLRGHYQYYGVPRNYEALRTFRYQTTLLWKRGWNGAANAVGFCGSERTG